MIVHCGCNPHAKRNDTALPCQAVASVSSPCYALLACCPHEWAQVALLYVAWIFYFCPLSWFTQCGHCLVPGNQGEWTLHCAFGAQMIHAHPGLSRRLVGWIIKDAGDSQVDPHVSIMHGLQLSVRASEGGNVCLQLKKKHILMAVSWKNFAFQ